MSVSGLLMVALLIILQYKVNKEHVTLKIFYAGALLTCQLLCSDFDLYVKKLVVHYTVSTFFLDEL